MVMSLPAVAPLLIGAVGGSGTRVLARILSNAGFFPGSRRNEAEDSESVMDFYNRWMLPYLVHGGVLPAQEAKEARRQFEVAIEEHRRGIASSSTPWLVKVPRTLLMLPYWHAAFPQARFIHMIRNGLDMAYSNDTNQLRMFGDLMLTAGEQSLPQPMRAMAYWRTANLRAAEMGKSLFPDRYHPLRFEDLCQHPETTLATLARFLQHPLAGMDVSPPPTIGRWRTQPADETKALITLGHPALEQFGYFLSSSS